MERGKVLIIDDNPVIVRLNESLLTAEGYAVISAKNGIEGVEKAKKEQPDFIILDLILPGKHGFEVCKELKSAEETKHTPIIIVTATGLEQVAEDEPEVQAEAYLAKPYGIEELKGALQQASQSK